MERHGATTTCPSHLPLSLPVAELQSFPGKVGVQRNHTRDISAWSRQVCDESQLHGSAVVAVTIGIELVACLAATSLVVVHEDVDLDIDELGGQARQSSHLFRFPTDARRRRSALPRTLLAQPPAK